MKTLSEIIFEAALINIAKANKLGLSVGVGTPDYHSISFKNLYHKDNIRQEKIGTLKGMDIHKTYAISNETRKEQAATFQLHDPKTNTTHLHVDLSTKAGKAGNKVYHVNALAGTGQSPVKAHDFYHHLLKTGHIKVLSSDAQSEGGQKVWQRLARKKTVHIHGWTPKNRDLENGQPVNINPRNPDETHANSDTQQRYYVDYRNDPKLADNTENELHNMHLVAHYKPIRKKRK